jgi:general secretion pathway protein I
MPRKNEKIPWLTGSKTLMSGFTLLEVMVALSVIATVLVSVYQLHTQSLSLATETRFHSYAPFLAQQKLAELATEAAAPLENESGEFGEDYPGLRWQVVVEAVESAFAEEAPVQLMRIDITISDSGDEYHYKMRTYRWAEL